MRYEVPAIIVLDADNEHEAQQAAERMTASINQESGPGAFFLPALAVVFNPRTCEEDREAETVSEHAFSLEIAAKSV